MSDYKVIKIPNEVKTAFLKSVPVWAGSKLTHGEFIMLLLDEYERSAALSKRTDGPKWDEEYHGEGVA